MVIHKQCESEDTNMTKTIMLDLIILMVLLVGMRIGWRRGLTMALGGALGLVCGLFGGRIAAQTIAPVVSQQLVYPTVAVAMKATLSAGVSDELAGGATMAVESLELFVNGVLEQLHLPSASLTGMLDDVMKLTELTGDKIAQAISLRISQMLVFVLAFLVLQAAALILCRMLDGILKLPIIGLPNRLAGAVLGVVSNGMWVVVTLWLLMLLPFFTQNGGMLSGAVLSETVLAEPLASLATQLLPKL